MRIDERARVAGTLRLMVKTGVGYLLASGEIIDLSAGGCAVRVGRRELEPGLKGRIEVTVGGRSLSLPVVTSWTRAEGDTSLVVGCRFFELNLTQQRSIHELLLETCAGAVGLPGNEASTG